MIFYLNDREPDWAYHSMIFLGGNARIGNDWIVYHTGPHGNAPGIVKKLRLSYLSIHPNKRWHPIHANPYFLGVYRWKILEQEGKR